MRMQVTAELVLLLELELAAIGYPHLVDPIRELVQSTHTIPLTLSRIPHPET